MILEKILQLARRQQILGPSAAPMEQKRLQRRASIHISNPASEPRPQGISQMPLVTFLRYCTDSLSTPPTLDEVWDFFDFIAPYVQQDLAKRRAMGILQDLLRSGGAMRVFT
jgi:hypothetical protein